MKTAFVASGGSLRAFAFHVGVMRALEDAGFRRMRAKEARHGATDRTISSYIGSSAGACFAVGSIFLDDLDALEGALGLNNAGPKLSRRKLFQIDLEWLWQKKKPSGLLYASGIADLVRELTGGREDFRTIGPELYVCATQLNGPRKVVFGPRDSQESGSYDKFIAYYNDVSIPDAVAASSSVPVMFRPYRIKNKASGHTFEYTDGEVRETLSVHVARDTDVELAIVSNTWMPYYYQRGVGSMSDRGLFAVLRQAISQAIEQKVDRFRYETDRYRETLDALREFAKHERLSEEQIENLVGQVSLTLNYRDIEEIYVAPDPDDADFCLMPSFTFDTRALGRAVETGFKRAESAIRAWQARRKS